MKGRRVTAPLLGVVLLAAGCVTQGAAPLPPSGFLTDDDDLAPGARGGASLAWKHPDFDLGAYDRLMLDPLEIRFAPDADGADVPPEQVVVLAAYFRRAVVDALGDAYPVVTAPGPGVLRVRTALTNVKPSRPALDTATNVPPARAVDLAASLVTGRHLFVGEAAIEAEFLDAQGGPRQGERMLAIVDRRAGGKTPAGVLDPWDDAESAFDHWAALLRERLDRAHETGAHGSAGDGAP
jgi:hypothetical protein